MVQNLKDTPMKIPLGSNKYALVDPEDYSYLSQWKWRLSTTGYARRLEYVKGSGRKNQKNRQYQMSRVIMNAPPGVEVDHINGDPLDNRRSNLRLCSHEENSRNMKLPSHNTSGFKGVVFIKTGKRIKRWIAKIKVSQETHYLGYFLTREEAAKNYNEAAKKHFGEFARMNEVDI